MVSNIYTMRSIFRINISIQRLGSDNLDNMLHFYSRTLKIQLDWKNVWNN